MTADCLAHCRVRNAVAVDQPVGDEVAVVGLVAELAAVRQPHRAVGQDLTNAVVLPLPDEPTLEARRRGDDRPVVSQ